MTITQTPIKGNKLYNIFSFIKIQKRAILKSENGENYSDCAYIAINYDTLNNRNKQITDNMVNGNTVTFIPKSDVCIRNYFNQIFIKIPTSPEETINSVERRLQNITQSFVPQRRIIKKMDPAQIIAMHMRAQNMK